MNIAKDNFSTALSFNMSLTDVDSALFFVSVNKRWRSVVVRVLKPTSY
jgi:hypothetical protein